MKNSLIFPFERNRYYNGKMLTSTDFQAEQDYINNKRRFINNMMFGSGIVCGCNVYNLDDLSLMIDSGVAVDSLGREIVIETGVVKKLSAMEGFDKLESSSALLCLSYDEESVNPMYAFSQGSEQTENNRIRENYKLFLIDGRELKEGFTMESEFLTKGVLADTEDYRLEIIMPAVVCMGKYAKIMVVLSKKTDRQSEFSYRGLLQTPSLVMNDGSHQFMVELSDNTLKNGEETARELWVKAGNVPSGEAKVLIQPGTAEAYTSGVPVELEENFNFDIVIEDITPRRLVDSTLGKTNLEMKKMSELQEYVKLAEIKFEKTENGYVINEIVEKTVKNYIETPADGWIRNEFMGYYSVYSPEEKVLAARERAEMPGAGLTRSGISMSEGTFEIPLGKGAKKGEIFYTGEIAHRLGSGNVYVEVGIQREENEIFFGSSDIFKPKDKNRPFPLIESGVRILSDKGIFQAGIRFLRDYDNMLLKCRWAAMKPEEHIERRNAISGGYITAERSSIILACGESTYIPVRFINMDEGSLTYNLTSQGTGEITDDGVYTAPEREGVYEIYIYCTDSPLVYTYCYAVVKEREKRSL